jgi:MraZ protein
MLLGEYEYKVDNKGRLPLPPKFRQEFGAGLVLTRGLEPCIFVYTQEEFNKLANTLSSNQIVAKSKMRKLNRSIFGSAFDLSLDGQGRIAIPHSLRESAKIGDTAVIVGAGKWIELWNPDLWNQERKESEEQAWQIIESLEGGNDVDYVFTHSYPSSFK